MYFETEDVGSSTQSQTLTVSQLTAQIKAQLEGCFPAVWVAGEITDLARPRSGHIYLTLKDDRAQIRGVIWRSTAERLRFDLQDGQAVICRGDLEVYAARGSYQLVIRQIQPQGIGGLQLAFQQLQRRLAAEGLFEPGRKKPLPRYPRRIGFVTSPTGAAIRDFLEVAARRSPAVQIVIIPAKVQGNGAAATICAGIAAAHHLQPPLDALVVGRGGGSLEDLWCFNEESVVRAIAASRLPIVSAVGHEIDVTLADLAADARALTPSEAAERLVPSADDLLRQLETFRQRLIRPVQARIEMYRSRLQALESRPLFARPHGRLHDAQRRLDELDLRGRRAMRSRLAAADGQLRQLAAALNALSPLAVLSRGYSVTIAQDDGRVITNSSQVAPGDVIQTRLARGRLISRVEAVEADLSSSPDAD